MAMGRALPFVEEVLRRCGARNPARLARRRGGKVAGRDRSMGKAQGLVEVTTGRDNGRDACEASCSKKIQLGRRRAFELDGG